MIKTLTLSTLAWCLATCAQSQELTEPKPGSFVPFWRLGPVINSGLHEPVQRVVGDQSEFNRLWNLMWANYASPPKPPLIDFTKESVIVLALGQRSTGGYDIHAGGITYAHGSLEVIVVTSSPGTGCPVTTSFTAPVELLRLSVPVRPTKFLAQANTRNCAQ